MLHKIEKLFEDGDVIYSEAQAKELLGVQAWYNKSLQDLNNLLAKKKSDVNVKYMKMDQQKKTTGNKPTPTTYPTTQKQTGTVTTTGQPVNADGSPVKNESYPDILKIKKVNEGFLDDIIRPTFEPYIHPDMKLEKNDYKGKIVDKRIDKKLLGGDKFIIYVKILGRDVEKFTTNADNYYDYEIGDTINVTIEESLNEEKFNTEMVEPDDLQNLKDYMDAESIPYIEDEDGTSIDFDKNELDDEWQSELEDIGLNSEDTDIDTENLIDMKDDNEEDEDEEYNEDNDIDEDKVFYVKIEDEAGDFTGKIYKLFDEGDWRTKVVDGESETFDKLNYDPDWDEYDIIAFLRENYDDANIIDKEEFNEHVENPEEESEEMKEGFRGINGNGNILNNQDNLDPTVEKDLLDDEDELNLKEGHHLPTLENFE